MEICGKTAWSFDSTTPIARSWLSYGQMIEFSVDTKSCAGVIG